MSVTGELRKNEINTVTPEYRTPETVQIPVQLVNIFSSGIQLPFDGQSTFYHMNTGLSGIWMVTVKCYVISDFGVE